MTLTEAKVQREVVLVSEVFKSFVVGFRSELHASERKNLLQGPPWFVWLHFFLRREFPFAQFEVSGLELEMRLDSV